MLDGFTKRAFTFEGIVRWTAQSSAVGVERMGDDLWSIGINGVEKPLISAWVFQPHQAELLEFEASQMETHIKDYPGYTFTGVSERGSQAIAAYVKTRLLRRLPAGTEGVPAQIALAYLSCWADTTEDSVGLYWTDGIQTLRVVTQDSLLRQYDDAEIDRVAKEIPWVDHSDPGMARQDRLNFIEGSCGFTGGAALAVGAATAVASECGGFVNPRLQTVARDGIYTTTAPTRQITISRRS